MYDFLKLDEKQTQKYENFIKKICKVDSNISKAKTEEDLRSIFESDLNQLLRDLEFIQSDYIIFEHETKHSSGRTDFLYGNTIIEYKKYGILKSKDIFIKSQQQIKSYLYDKQYDSIKMYGFIFDGKVICAFEKDEKNVITLKEKESGELTAYKIGRAHV